MNEMINPVVRLSSLTLENIKNVRKGTVCVPMAGITKAGVLGIYGQNGSGKTTVIDALYFLQQISPGFARKLWKGLSAKWKNSMQTWAVSAMVKRPVIRSGFPENIFQISGHSPEIREGERS